MEKLWRWYFEPKMKWRKESIVEDIDVYDGSIPTSYRKEVIYYFDSDDKATEYYILKNAILKLKKEKKYGNINLIIKLIKVSKSWYFFIFIKIFIIFVFNYLKQYF
jgi:hypothetical protein